MMKHLITFTLLLFGYWATAQTIADFENFTIESESFLNGSDGSMGFTSGPVFLPNDYNADFDSWSGWAISNTTDNTTPGFLNQYSAIPGGGANASSNYAVTFVLGSTLLSLEGEPGNKKVEGLYLTNSTYAYWSMLEGDAFAKKFGGVTGDDPDFFLLTVKSIKNGLLSSDSVDFYLADYRFEDNAQDYIIDDWNYLDLSSLEAADSLVFILSSSDVGQFGMNTPAYFCIDDVDVTLTTTSTPNVFANPTLEIFPNPATSFLNLKGWEEEEGLFSIYDYMGIRVLEGTIQQEDSQIDLTGLVKGMYIIEVKNDGLAVTKKFSKL